MSFTIKEIKFHHFRNYGELRLLEFPEITVIVGENAIGKTNILEGIQLLTSAHSFRNPTNEQLIQKGKEDSFISYIIQNEERDLTVSMGITSQKKVFQINGKNKRSADIKGILPSVTFVPGDLEIVQGSQSYRRTTLDALGTQLSQNYHRIQNDYEKVIRQKNKLLKEEVNHTFLDSINELVLTVGTQYTYYRQNLLEKIKPLVKENYRKISHNHEILDIKYIPSFIEEDSPEVKEETSQFTREEIHARLEKQLFKKTGEEIVRHKAVVGPQSDRVFFYLNGENAGLFGSQGQQRSIVLAWKMAEVELIDSLLHTKPVLLLDDVMSELDEYRRNALMDSLSTDMQVFITTTEEIFFEKKFSSAMRVIELPQK